MTRKDLAKIFNEVDATFHESEIYKATIADIDERLKSGKNSPEVILFNGAFELSKRFMFEVMSKAFCAAPEVVQADLQKNAPPQNADS